MGCLFYLAALIVKSVSQQRLNLLDWLLLPVSTWLLWNLKYYFIGIFFPVAVAFIIAHTLVRKIFPGKRQIALFFFFGILLILLALVTLFHPNLEMGYFQEVIVSNYNDYQGLSAPGDAIQYQDLSSDTWSIVRNSPLALVSGLFRPFIWESNSVIKLLAGIENLVIFILFVSSFFYFKKRVSTQGDYTLALALLVYITLLCVFLSLSTPNLGTISRYRVGFLSFFVFLITFENPLIEWVANNIQKKK
jgi:hypothetical protein